MLNFFFYLTMTLFLIVCLFMMLLVLIQKGRGGGLSSAFGGAGGNTAFGSKTGDVLTWATSIVFGIFLVLGIALNLLANEVHYRQTRGMTAVAAPATPPAQRPVPSNVPPPVPDPGVRTEQVPPAAQGAPPPSDGVPSTQAVQPR